MAYSIKEFEKRCEDVKEWLSREFVGIRTGRATPLLLDLVHVDAYGSKMSMQQVGSINVEDARTLRVAVWDQSLVKAVEKAIIDSNLGVSAVGDSGGVRIIFPELTSERRVQLLKIAKAKHEEARVSLRGARDEVMKEIDKLEKEGEMSQDEKTRAKEEVQKRVDGCNAALESQLGDKEREINT